MIVDDFIIEVRDADYIRQGQLIDADLTNFLAVPRANNIGSWQVVLPQNVLAADGTETPHAMCALLRTPGSGLVVTNSRTGLVEISGPLDHAEHDATTSDPGGTWTLTGLSDTTILAEAEAWPDPTDPDPANQAVANDIRSAAAETLIHEFVDANIGPSATMARRNARLTMGTDLGRGPTLIKSPRFTNLLTLCQSIATGTTLLFDVAQVGDQLELRTWEADDLTDDIRMDLANGQLSSVKYAYSRPTLTHVTVLGQGEGVDRQVVARTTTEALAAATLWGVRIERSLDQRHTDDVDELQQAADEALAEEGLTITSLQVAPSGDQTDNFGVGDFVTVVVGGQQVPAQVTEMPISITAEGVFVGCTVGDPNGFDWESLIVSRQAGQEKRLARLERSAEVPASLYSQAEVDALFYTRSALDGGQLDTRYYTEAEINALVSAKGRTPSSVVVGSGSAAAAAGGLVTFTAVPWLSLNGVFAGGGVYELFMRYTATNDIYGFGYRLRAAGVDSTVGYDNQRGQDTVASSTSQQTLNGNTGVLAVTSASSSGWQFALRCLIFWPDVADETLSISNGIQTPNPMSTASGTGHFRVGSQHRSLTAYDGISFIATSGLFTGACKVVQVA